MHARADPHVKMAASKSVPKTSKPFLCGVVEGKGHTNTILYTILIGFYGRPWTTDQRLDLFTW